jgi:hypothetical protein
MRTGPSPITLNAQDNLYEKALSFAGGNRYLALKILALYGHDNMANTLRDVSFDCRARIMDAIRPMSSTSQLYHSGAIGSITYSSDQINRGNTVASECQSAYTALARDNSTMARELNYMCNDGYERYQSDYYHVLASAFISCRGEVANNHAYDVARPNAGPVARLADDSAGAARIVAIRGYKAARFREEVERSTLSTTIKVYLRYALAKISANLDPFDQAWIALSFTLTPHESAMIRATVNRYRHEIQFRSYQNQLGSQFALTSCHTQNHFLNNDGDVSPGGKARDGAGHDEALHPDSSSHGQRR